jgi:predicted phage-related endonuclease
MIETLTPASREEWLAIRRNAVGGSEVAAVLDCHEYLTQLELWSRKTGRVPELEPTADMKRGNRLESVALDILREENPAWTVTPNVIGQGGKLFIDREAHMACTPDAFVQDEAGRRGVVQIKSVHPGAFAKWRNELPLRIALQVYQEAALTGASWAIVAALVIDRGADVHILDVPLVGEPERLRDAIAAFWRFVETDTPPPSTPGRDLATIKAIALSAPKPAEPEISLDGDNTLLDALANYTAANDEITALRGNQKVAEARLKGAEEIIREKIGAHTIATAGDYEIMQKRIDRKAYEVKASSSLRLTVSRRNASKEAA